MRIRILLFLLSCCLAGSATATDDNNSFTLYLVRHAEKQPDGSRDPELTATGRDRAEQLANWLQDKDIKDIWSSDYKRTRGTAKPLTKKLGLEAKLYDPGNLAGLAGQLQNNHRNAYVVGHSNTTPELARLLCKCPIADMDESEHDRLIEISIEGKKVQATTLKQGELFNL